MNPMSSIILCDLLEQLQENDIDHEVKHKHTDGERLTIFGKGGIVISVFDIDGTIIDVIVSPGNSVLPVKLETIRVDCAVPGCDLRKTVATLLGLPTPEQ